MHQLRASHLMHPPLSNASFQSLSIDALESCFRILACFWRLRCGDLTPLSTSSERWCLTTLFLGCRIPLPSCIWLRVVASDGPSFVGFSVVQSLPRPFSAPHYFGATERNLRQRYIVSSQAPWSLSTPHVFDVSVPLRVLFGFEFSVPVTLPFGLVTFAPCAALWATFTIGA